MENKVIENKTQKTNFTQVPNEILNSQELSWRAKGLWAYMAGKPEGWEFTIKSMASQCKDSYTATNSAVKELLEIGLIKREIVMTKNGKKCFYSIYEKPNMEKPNMEKPSMEKPSMESQCLESQVWKINGYSNTNISNKEKVILKKSNTNISKVDSREKARRFQKPSVEEVRAYCEERKNKVDAESFVDFYESKGWVVGKSPMKNWKAAVRTWERNGYGQSDNQVSKVDEVHVVVEGEDITYQRMFEKWKQYLGVGLKQTESQVKACNELLEDLGEDGLERLIVALRMRSEHGYLTRELKSVKDFVTLNDNKMVVQNFYNEHWRMWQMQQEANQQGKKIWEL